MAFSLVQASINFHCPICQVYPGEQCWPRAEDDAPWVHHQRVKVMHFNTHGPQGFTLVSA